MRTLLLLATLAAIPGLMGFAEAFAAVLTAFPPSVLPQERRP